MKPRAVDFISYSVTDMDRSEAFYRDVLGLDVEVPRGEAGKMPDVAKELKVISRPVVLLAMATTVMGAGAMFTLYTYVAPVLADRDCLDRWRRPGPSDDSAGSPKN